MAEHIFFNGRKYYRTPSGYWQSSYPRPTKLLHVAVWEATNGEVPEGCVIHHVDRDKSNNAIENLQCLTISEHCTLHAREQGQSSQSIHCICVQCGSSFLAHHHDAKFCSTKCYNRWYREHNDCNEERFCVRCGKPFKTRKDTATKYCSGKCAALERENKKRKQKIAER